MLLLATILQCYFVLLPPDKTVISGAQIRTMVRHIDMYPCVHGFAHMLMPSLLA